MKVIVAGYIKTGTKSLAAALARLGYSVYDQEHHFYYLGDDWKKIFTKGGTVEDFRRMYEHVDAGADVPFNVFWEEIFDAFPEAKIIFMQRSSEEVWEKSLFHQIEMFNKNYLFRLLSVFSYTGYKFFCHLGATNRILFANHYFLPWNICDGISPTIAKKRYRDHCNSVLTSAPKDRLLVFNLKDGWEPLCEFLKKEVPDVPFPHDNAGGELLNNWMKENPVINKMKREMKISVSVLTAFLCFAIYKFGKSTLKVPNFW